MSRKVNQRTVDLVKEFEGYETRLANGDCLAYLDTLPLPSLRSPGYAGLWTIGWGSTGPGITQGTRWTEAKAELELTKQINKKAAEVEAYLTYPVNDNQFGALVSLAYNIGTGGIHGILNLINQGHLDAAASSFVNYNHAGGVVVGGLTRRRLAERELFEWETPKEVKAMSPELQTADKVQAGMAVGGLSFAGLMNYIPQVSSIVHDNAGALMLGMLTLGFGGVYLWKQGYHIAFGKGTYVPTGTKPVPAPVDIEGTTDASVTV